MKLTEIQRCIIVVNIIGVILEEYRSDEITPSIQNLITKCERFRDKRSGVEIRRMRDRNKQLHHGPVIVDAKRYDQYMQMNVLGDRIWGEAVDHFSKQHLKIDAVSLIESIYLFNETILAKHAKIKRDDIDAYRYEFTTADYSSSIDGTAVGGHLMGLLMREMGIEVNGKLRALKLKIEDHRRVA